MRHAQQCLSDLPARLILICALAAATAGPAIPAAELPRPGAGAGGPEDAAPRLAAAAHALLARRCVSCHGAGKMSGLDLRTREGVLRGGPSGGSGLWALGSGPGRAARARTEGAHGSPGSSGSEPRAQSPEPRAARRVEVRWPGWVRNPIDAFVLSRLEEDGLSPAPPAGRRELIRRLSFDLTGLPPEPEAVERFVEDRSAGAYERLVDRLLASPRYGERWASHWLDVVRFAESQGFERDILRDHAWRYRDYVIRAFNTDMPYNRFVREQIAGDVLPRPTRESIVATGFLVAGPWDEVGNNQQSATMRARVREDELEDMVSATAQTFLGLTVNCARCHDHKFGPIPQRDYYRIQAALAGVRHGDRSILPKPESLQREASVRFYGARVEALETRMAALEAAGRQRVVARQLAERPADLLATAPAPIARWTFEGEGRDSLGHLDVSLEGGAEIRHGRLRLNGKSATARTVALPRTLAAKTLEVWVVLGRTDQRGGGVMTVEDQAGGIFDSIVYGERQARKWIAGSEFFRRTKDLTAPEEEAPAGDLLHLAITYGADRRIALYRNGRLYGEPYTPELRPKETPKSFTETGRVLFGLRFSQEARPTDDRWFAGEIEEARLYDRALTPDEVAASFGAGPPLVTRSEAVAALSTGEMTERERLARELERERARLKRVSDEPRAYAANPKAPPEVHLLARGDIGRPGELLSAGGLTCISALNSDWGLAPDAPDGERRLRLAAWITDPANPLTPRVIVNRIWQHHFGRGLVASPSDFGVNGDRPTHPELLDWLAATFRASGGSIKRLHRLVVTSNTYRQGVAFNARAAAVDAENRHLWRMSPRRLEAEALRDAMLAVSGEINLKAGGPGFRPFSVVVNNTHFYTYEDRTGAEYDRRSVYRTVVNSGGIPLLESFDCPDPSVKTPRRGSTTTPLQALTLLNSSFVLRQAKAFAGRLRRETGADPGRQVDRAYRCAFARPPSLAEAKRAAAFVQRHGLAPFCRVLLNASEFVYLR